MKGVQKTPHGTFRVAVRDGRKIVHLGCYLTEEEAGAVASAAFARRDKGEPVAPQGDGGKSDYEVLSAYFSYNPETGQITRLKSAKAHKRGEVVELGAGSHGYPVVSFKNRPVLIHRLAWLLMTGSWPGQWIDHINGITTDNRWVNLRAATPAQNIANTKTRISRTGYRGVVLRDKAWKRRKKYTAVISVDGRRITLGNFECPEEASRAYIEAAKFYYGEYARMR